MSEKTINGNTYLGDVNLEKTAINDLTNSGSTTTGALTVAGGVGIAGNLNVGGSITGGSISYASTTTGTMAVTNTTNATSTTTGVLTVAGGMGVAKDIYAANLRLTQYLNVSGTGVPVATLQVNGNGTIGNQAGHFIANNLYFDGTWKRIDTSCPGYCIRVGSTVDFGNGMQFFVGDTSNYPDTRMLIQPDGKVGIGTKTPAYTLDVNGTVNITGSTIIGGDTQINGALVSNNVIPKTKTISSTGTTTLSASDGTIVLNTSGGAVTIVLPSAVGSYSVIGTIIKFVNVSGTITIRNNSNTTTLATITNVNGILSLLNTNRATADGTWIIVENNMSGSSTNTSTVACQILQSNSSGTTNSIPLGVFNNYAGAGSETLLAVGNSLLTKECAQLSFYRGATQADNEIRINQYGDTTSGITLKSGQAKIGSGTYFGYTESTYTPTTRNEDNSGVISYTTQTGNYVKTGKQCTAYCRVQAQYTFPQSGKKIYVTLPFTIAYYFSQSIIDMSYDGTTYLAGVVWGLAGTNEILIKYYKPGGLTNPIDTVNLLSTTSITQDLDITVQCTFITT